MAISEEETEFHISPTKGVQRCSAKIKCRFADLDVQHFSTRDDADRYFNEKWEEVLAKRGYFEVRLLEAAKHLTDAEGGYYLERSFVEPGRSRAFGSWVNREIRDLFPSRENFTEDEVSILSRDVTSELTKEGLHPGQAIFWDKFYTKVADPFARNTSKSRKLKDGVYGEDIGSVEVAEKFMKIMKDFPVSSDESDSEYSVEYPDLEDFLASDLYENLVDEGFLYCGEGGEQIAFYHEPSKTVWKHALWNVGDEYVRQQMVSQDTFPKLDKVRHAKTAAYVSGNSDVIAPEYLPAERIQRPPAKSEEVALQLSGQNDNMFTETQDPADPNILVAFDTAGEVWGDVDSYPLKPRT